LLFYFIFWQNRSKHHGQKTTKLRMQNFWHLGAKRPKTRQKHVGSEPDAHYPAPSHSGSIHSPAPCSPPLSLSPSSQTLAPPATAALTLSLRGRPNPAPPLRPPTPARPPRPPDPDPRVADGQL
jgi:hypothetical protein